ncbi:MAG: hypothetical protein RR441_07190 [Longicatena sp.]
MKIKYNDINKDSSSASGTASQIPKTPYIVGSTSNAMEIKTNVLSDDIIADTIPLDSAVKVADAKILMPQNRKLIGKIRNPSLAI